MIALHRLNGEEIVLNCELIEYLEATPDTVITLANGNKMIVKECIDNIVEQIVQYKQRCMSMQPGERVKKT